MDIIKATMKNATKKGIAANKQGNPLKGLSKYQCYGRGILIGLITGLKQAYVPEEINRVLEECRPEEEFDQECLPEGVLGKEE